MLLNRTTGVVAREWLTIGPERSRSPSVELRWLIATQAALSFAFAAAVALAFAIELYHAMPFSDAKPLAVESVLRFFIGSPVAAILAGGVAWYALGVAFRQREMQIKRELSRTEVAMRTGDADAISAEHHVSVLTPSVQVDADPCDESVSSYLLRSDSVRT